MKHPLLQGPILPTLLRLSLPNMIAMLASALVAVAETAYVGILGTTPLAGLALVFPMVMLQQMMSAGAMGGGISSAVSRALGAGDVARASAVAVHAIVIGAVGGLAFTAIFLLFGESLYRLLGGSGAVLNAALEYSNIAFLGAVGIWLANTFASVLRGTGNMRTPSVVLFAAAVSQIALGGALGLGLGPIPRLGLFGVGLGLTLSFLAATVFLGWYVLAGRTLLTFDLATTPLRWETFREILRVGAIACLSPVQSVLTVLIVTAAVARFGPEALAGYGIGARLEFLLVPIAFAVGVASVPMVGLAVGHGDIERARRTAWIAGAVAATATGLIGLLVFFWPDAWIECFSRDPAVGATARRYFAFAGLGYGFFGLGLALYFSAQGAGRILGPVLAQSVRLAVIVVGSGVVAGLSGSVDGLFATIALSLVAYGLAATFAVYVVRWQKS